MKPITDSEIIRRARAKIVSKKESHVCIAIASVRAPKEQKESLRAWVRHMLEGHTVLEQWLSRYHEKAYRSMSWSQRQEARLQWLDWMIAYYEKEEAK